MNEVIDYRECLISLFEEFDENIDNYFPTIHNNDDEQALKAKFMDRKRVIRNQLYYEFKSTINPKMDYERFCNQIDKMQDVDFSRIILGSNFLTGSERSRAFRKHAVICILQHRLTFSYDKETFQMAVYFFDQYVLTNPGFGEVFGDYSKLLTAIIKIISALFMDGR